ncbi:hypothetical protein AXI59_02895 [Bacillus nakamurai]|uniref:hypothetical protein n=1 Tax=Bacillus nakamurai TaxID=1793963 RepID=UPI000778250A|nr:hypothetical protein [Bacillus nakamurai]KXZ14813.1 hypothetical protein AXI59_02895 [Bacillus nakamurai]
MKTSFFKKTVLTAAVTASAALLACSPLDSAGAKTLSPDETHFLQSAAQKNPEDLTKLLDIINQLIYEKDGAYYFDSEKAGIGKEQAQLYADFFHSLPQKVLESIYTGLHPAA